MSCEEDDITTEEEMSEYVSEYLFEPIQKVRKLPWIHAFEELPNQGCSFFILGGQFGPMFDVVIR